MNWPLLSAALLVGVGAGALWYVSATDGSSSPDQTPVASHKASSTAQVDAEPVSPFAIDETVKLGGELSATVQPAQSAGESPTDTATLDASLSQQIPSWDEPLTSEQLGILVSQLKADPALLQQLIEQFRQETDPVRKKLLASVLGEVGGEQATLLASELIFSGDHDARSLGLYLLQKVQPGNAEARDIVSGMLATTVEPTVLVETLTALAAPGDVDAQSRAYLSDQVAWLTTHQDDGVRSVSLDILSRWSDDGRYTEVLLTGLEDDSEYVRSSAAYSLAKQEDRSPVVIEQLLLTLRKPTELKTVKQAAIFALRAMPLSPSQANEINALEKLLNTVAR